MKRRTFLAKSATAVAGGVYLANVGCQSSETGSQNAAGETARKLEKIGVQLYTIRSKMAEDFEGSIRKVAEIGYKEVEFAGYYNRKPEDVRALLDEVGLTAPAVHVQLPAVQNNIDQLIETAQIVGHKYLICPWVNIAQFATADSWKQLAADLNKAGEKCREAGLRFGYHNHDFEFEAVEEQLPFDILLAEADAALVDIEIDLFWIAKAGHDPFKYFQEHAGRFKLCHVKDMTEDGNMVDVGKGQIDFSQIFAKSEQAGLTHYFVEHDRPEDPFASIEASFNHLNALTF